MTWTKYGASLILNSLTEDDYLSIVLFNSGAQLLLPATQVTNSSDVEALISTISAGGGTDMYSGMLMGYAQINLNLSAFLDNRMVILSDGYSITSDSELLDLAQTYSDEGITISTIAVGAGANTNLLSEMAEVGNGQYCFVNNFSEMTQGFINAVDQIIGHITY